MGEYNRGFDDAKALYCDEIDELKMQAGVDRRCICDLKKERDQLVQKAHEIDERAKDYAIQMENEIDRLREENVKLREMAFYILNVWKGSITATPAQLDQWIEWAKGMAKYG